MHSYENAPIGNHRRILSQQNPLVDGSNIDQFIADQQSGTIQQHQISNNGKIVVINNNNTNINIHHAFPTQDYPPIVKKPGMHKKNI